MDQWNRAESPEIDPHKYSQLTFDKGAQATQWNKEKSFQQIVLEQLDSHMQKENLDTDLTSFTKSNSKS